MEENCIPGNLHFKSPNTDIPGLQNGQLKVIDRNSKWQGGLVGINSFGFGGSNVHAVLKSNSARRSKDVPCNGCEKKRLFLYASRSEEGLKESLKVVRDHSNDMYLHSLMNETADLPPSSHPFRGYTILNGSEAVSVQVGSAKQLLYLTHWTKNRSTGYITTLGSTNTRLSSGLV